MGVIARLGVLEGPRPKLRRLTYRWVGVHRCLPQLERLTHTSPRQQGGVKVGGKNLGRGHQDRLFFIHRHDMGHAAGAQPFGHSLRMAGAEKSYLGWRPAVGGQ